MKTGCTFKAQKYIQVKVIQQKFKLKSNIKVNMQILHYFKGSENK